MGNVYRYMECDECKKLIDVPHDYTFIVHGSQGLTELMRLEKERMVVGKIAAHFCGYCGGYVPLRENKCNCGNFMYQGWNYDGELSPMRWEEPWKEERERQDGPTMTLSLAER